MKTAALATMGTSPPVITEFVEYVQRTENLQHLTILSTTESLVLNGAILAKEAIRGRYPKISVHIHRLPLNDITSEDENYIFIEESAKVIAQLKKKYDNLHICLAGGRKEMVASIMMVAQLMNLSSVYHIVSPYIKEMNIELEKIRHDIDQLAASEDPQSHYEKNREKFERVLFPPAQYYSAIKLQILPYPEDYVHLLKTILSRGGEASRAVRDHLNRLKRARLITLTKGGKIIVTEEGKKLYEHLLRYL